MKRWPTVPVAPRMPTFIECVAWVFVRESEDMERGGNRSGLVT